MNYTKLLTITLLTLGLVLVPAKKAFGNYYYGGVEEVDVSIDKMVKDPQSGNFVDNLSVDDYRFAPEQEIEFRLTVKNTGDKTLNHLDVKDIFPSYVDFVSGPGSWDSNSRTLSFDFENLESGKSRDFGLVGRIFAEKDLPEVRTCVTNKGEVRANDEYDEDSASLCFERKAALPPTGVESTFIFGILLVGAVSALVIRKELI